MPLAVSPQDMQQTSEVSIVRPTQESGGSRCVSTPVGGISCVGPTNGLVGDKEKWQLGTNTIMPKDKGAKKSSRKRPIAVEEEDDSTANAKVVILKQKAFACLSETCEVVITTSWKDALRHMQKCDRALTKPKIKESMAKAVARVSVLPPKEVDLTNVSEEELVNVITEYYDSVSDRPAAKKHVLHRAIRPKYGNFEFGKFGFGTFVEFTARHHLEVYAKPQKRRKTNKKLQAEADTQSSSEEASSDEEN